MWLAADAAECEASAPPRHLSMFLSLTREMSTDATYSLVSKPSGGVINKGEPELELPRHTEHARCSTAFVGPTQTVLHTSIPPVLVVHICTEATGQITSRAENKPVCCCFPLPPAPAPYVLSPMLFCAPA